MKEVESTTEFGEVLQNAIDSKKNDINQLV